MVWFRKILRIEPGLSLGWWVYERILSSWAGIASLFGGGIMTYFAAISDWLNPWGPIGWATVGLLSFLMILITVTLVQMGIAWKRSRNVLSEFTRRQSTIACTNPLHDDFDREQIKIGAFYHPYYESNEKKTFKSCEIFGPCNIILNGYTNMPRAKFIECDFVIIDTSRPIHGVVGFNNCTFLDCSFYRITFFVNVDMARSLKHQILESGTFDGPEALNIVSDGTFGNI